MRPSSSLPHHNKELWLIESIRRDWGVIAIISGTHRACGSWGSTRSHAHRARGIGDRARPDLACPCVALSITGSWSRSWVCATASSVCVTARVPLCQWDDARGTHTPRSHRTADTPHGSRIRGHRRTDASRPARGAGGGAAPAHRGHTRHNYS